MILTSDDQLYRVKTKKGAHINEKVKEDGSRAAIQFDDFCAGAPCKSHHFGRRRSLVPYGCADTVPRPLDQGQIGLLGHGHRLTADGKGAQITETEGL